MRVARCDLVAGRAFERGVLAAGEGGAREQQRDDQRFHGAAPKRTNTASASTKSPGLACTEATVAACGAFRLSSIFIASITAISWPSLTTSPSFTLITT